MTVKYVRKMSYMRIFMLCELVCQLRLHILRIQIKGLK